MATKTKKVILFIAEGYSDENALYPILKQIFHNGEIHFHIVGGDVTSDWNTDGNNAVKKIHEILLQEIKITKFKAGDIIKVVHLIDTDGAFIPDDNVIAGDVKNRIYEENQILTKNPQEMLERNHRKSQVLMKLFPAGKINSFSYEVYYFSRNLEHVLHNICTDLTADEKMDYADKFADAYHGHADKFIKFLSESDFSVNGDYKKTWDFIFSGTNSLHRHCNLHLLFK